ncbi:ArsR/SmtB family transcription factor [Compostimonas suwonensis]|uniref:DNA-binding transcriptional ArsR family regulator n=1 Tax=Compostimonas suwonensis TaxID=1048394 RepID=A0A2M9C3K1_9MICO|nr:metalloregulator ArsR/SmtB family transcription factor [Compostimonas suwonensis]PJJ65037.1 DNA-binding transcriptional ArsR family regulator [Compostimonas suwonensis]
MADIFDVVADSTRRDILGILLERYEAGGHTPGEISVSEIVNRLGLSQPTVSKHLKVLRDAGLVTVREEGQHRYYRLDYSPLEQVEDWLIPFLSADLDEEARRDELAVALGTESLALAERIGKAAAATTHQVQHVVNPKKWRKS